ncbi:4Fe-4S dicluster domain-containing protein, partial [bacterium]|nr:4Fe-4S dicluster domain-containing protein [bacterium]
PFELGAVLASSNVAALDWIAASCVGYDPRRLPYLVDAIARGGFDPGTPALEVGPRSVEEMAAEGFNLLPYGGSTSAALSAIPAFVRPLMTKLLTDRPIFHPDRCTGCSACVRICPASALVLGKNARGQHQIRIDDEACITCFCCHEVCPSHAISVGKVLTRRHEERKLS